MEPITYMLEVFIHADLCDYGYVTVSITVGPKNIVMFHSDSPIFSTALLRSLISK